MTKLKAVETEPLADSFDDFLTTPRYKSNRCLTCANEEWSALCRRYVDKLLAGQYVPSRRQLYDHLVANYGYTLKPTSLGAHIRDCLKAPRE